MLNTICPHPRCRDCVDCTFGFSSPITRARDQLLAHRDVVSARAIVEPMSAPLTHLTHAGKNCNDFTTSAFAHLKRDGERRALNKEFVVERRSRKVYEGSLRVPRPGYLILSI
jgi:hypothetical protein